MSKIEWVFQDEQGTNLNRYIATNVSTGEKITFDLLRGGSIAIVGTLLNAETLNKLISAINDNYNLITNIKDNNTTYSLSQSGNTITLKGSDNSSTSVTITKSNVGLSDVVNTGDSATPVSGGTTKFTTGGAYTELNKKVDKTTTINGKALSSNITISKSDVGLGNVDNTSDANKPISNATQEALDKKVNNSITINDKSLTSNISLAKSDIGLSNVDNTSDETKKTNFTGAIESGNTGFVTGGDVYNSLVNNTFQVTKSQSGVSEWTYSASATNRFIICANSINGATLTINLLNASGTSVNEKTSIGLFTTIIVGSGTLKTSALINDEKVSVSYGSVKVTSSGTFDVYRITS